MNLKESGINKAGTVLDESVRSVLDFTLFNIIKSEVKKKYHTNNVSPNPHILYISRNPSALVSRLVENYPNGFINFLDIESSSFTDKHYEGSFNVFSSLEQLSAKCPFPIDVIVVDNLLDMLNDDIGFLKWICTFDIVTEYTVVICHSPSHHLYFNSEDLNIGRVRRYTERILIHHFNRAGLLVLKSGSILFSLVPESLFFKFFVKRPESHFPSKVKFSFLLGILLIDTFVVNLLKYFRIIIKGAFCYVIARKVDC